MEVDDLEITERPSAKAHDNGAVTIKRARTQLIPKHERERIKRNKQAQRDYGRGNGIDVKTIKDKKLRRNLKGLEQKYKQAAESAKDAEILLENTSGFLEAEEELERTWRVTQNEIESSVSLEASKKRFDLKLDQLGPYQFDYDRTGRMLLLGGARGHIATMDWRQGKLGCEINLQEKVRAVKYLHNTNYFSVSQKNQVYIYDSHGVELHCMRNLQEVTHMDFLPYHYLLTTLRPNPATDFFPSDVSTGKLVSEIRTGLGQPVSMALNPWNAIVHAGHNNGTVTLWSPNSTEPLVKLLCHKGPVKSVAVDREGRYMVSCGNDRKMAVWDIRMFREVNNYFTRTPASSVSISDRGVTAVGWSTSVTLWKDLFVKHRKDQIKVESPYMTWGGEGKSVEQVKYCPYEDVLGIGHDEGFSSIIVPGAGEANFDAMEVNPYETVKQRREAEVKGLLNKLQPEMIALDPNFIGNLDLRSDQQRREARDLDAKPVDIETDIKNRMRGKNSALRKYLRKQRAKNNIIDEKRLKVDELWKQQQEQNQERRQEKAAELGPALGRFARKEQ
ncbi:putative UTP7-U3 snoRNP protein [Apiospora rasikravindrae]|uniref:UTP7-U3 snoRNP protein n=1 Tax=Apiospora rasikravindrae TaxID=990691 RepID=A0ABR1SZG2_9PEZI